jgi:hypothetical protein
MRIETPVVEQSLGRSTLALTSKCLHGIRSHRHDADALWFDDPFEAIGRPQGKSATHLSGDDGLAARGNGASHLRLREFLIG